MKVYPLVELHMVEFDRPAMRVQLALVVAEAWAPSEVTSLEQEALVAECNLMVMPLQQAWQLQP